MPGAIVPNDWDGIAYTERRLRWPNSPLWLEILRGGLSQSALVSFWDEATGDVVNASTIGQELIVLNTAGGLFPAQNEVNMARNYMATVLSFANQNQTFPVGVWTNYTLNSLVVEIPSPNKGYVWVGGLLSGIMNGNGNIQIRLKQGATTSPAHYRSWNFAGVVSDYIFPFFIRFPTFLSGVSTANFEFQILPAGNTFQTNFGGQGHGLRNLYAVMQLDEGQ